MTKAYLVLSTLALVVIGTHSMAHGIQADARILRGITVDGSLSEWPDDMQRYRIANPPSAYYGATVEDDEDLTAWFMVGYDPDADLVHIGVWVRDDELVVGSNHQNTDACEIYIHSGEGRGGPTQMVLVPGGASYGGRSHGQSAYSRHGEMTTYEWSIPVPAREQKLRDLVAGRVLGFDIVIVDKDQQGPAAWVPWGNGLTGKTGGLDRVGRLQLSDQEADSGFFDGMSGSGLGLLIVGALAVGIVGIRRSNLMGDRVRLVEKRLSDLQEIVLSLSEEVERLKKKDA